MRNPIILALDVPDAIAAERLIDLLAPVVGAFKVGLEIFTAAGPDLVRKARGRGVGVFLDLKLHDIPSTVAKAVAAAVGLDVQMLTVHAAGGSKMLRAAEDSAQHSAAKLNQPPPLVLGVTVLTSLDSQDLAEVGAEPNVGRQVERLANLAVAIGLRGLVCSPLEVAMLRQILPSHISLVVPGLRMKTAKSDDQKRTLTPAEAWAAGADWLVMGRPIHGAPDPRTAAEGILASLPSR